MSSMCGVNEFQSAFPSGIPAGPTTPAGCAKHCATMAKALAPDLLPTVWHLTPAKLPPFHHEVLTLDVRAALDFHSFPKDMNRRWRSQELFLKEMRAALEAANEDDPSGKRMLPRPGIFSCMVCNAGGAESP